MNQIIYQDDIKGRINAYLINRTNRLKVKKVKFEYNKYYKGSLFYLIKLNLERQKTNTANPSYLFFEFIDKHLGDILIGRASVILKINQEFEKKFKLKQQIEFYECEYESKPTLKDVKKILSDHLFVYGKLKEEDRRLVLSSVKNKLCPYCSRNYINLIRGVDKNMGVNLDHYYGQSKYPLLAISFFNFIPSCQPCNSTFKGGIEFDQSFIHPIVDSVESGKFTLKLTRLDGKYNVLYFLNESNFEVDYAPNFSKKYKEVDYYKFKKSVEFFKLKEIYNEHKDVVQRTLIDYYVYTEGGVLKSIQKVFPKLNLKHKALGISTSKKDWSIFPFGKLRYDILTTLIDKKVNELTDYNDVF